MYTSWDDAVVKLPGPGPGPAPSSAWVELWFVSGDHKAVEDPFLSLTVRRA
jgi:hypothetical protein